MRKDLINFGSFFDELPTLDFSKFLRVDNDFKFDSFVDKGDFYELNLRLPYLDNVSVSVENGYVTVSVKRTQEHGTSSTTHSYSLPNDAIESTLSATVTNDENVLTLKVDKNKETQNPNKIEVEFR